MEGTSKSPKSSGSQSGKNKNPQDEPASTLDSAVTETFIELLKKHPKGVVDADIQIEMPDLTPTERVEIINDLLAKGTLDLFNQGGKLVYKYKKSTPQVSGQGADSEEKVVLRIIEEVGNKGIWMRDIRYQSNLLPTQLNKILKALENKKLIKAVKSVSVSTYLPTYRSIILFTADPIKRTQIFLYAGFRPPTSRFHSYRLLAVCKYTE